MYSVPYTGGRLTHCPPGMGNESAERMNALVKAPRLELGDTIGIVACSSPLEPPIEEQYARGKQIIRDMGFELKEGEHLRTTHWYSAETARAHAGAIHTMFLDPGVKAVTALIGGYGGIAVVDHLDHDLIRAHPKPFLGASDVTVLQTALYTHCGLVGLHTNSVYDLGAFLDRYGEPEQEYLLSLYTRSLTDPEPLARMRPLSQWETWRPGRARGHLLGGSLKRFVALAGTRHFPPLAAFEGAILFWEEIGGDTYDVFINLHHLKQMGIFERLAGMIVGKVMWISPSSHLAAPPSVQEVLLDAVANYQFPILASVDFGHNQVAIPMPIGISAEMDADNHELRVLEGTVR